MASDDEFRIKGAAQTSDVPPPASSEPEEQSEEQSEHADHTEEAEEVSPDTSNSLASGSVPPSTGRIVGDLLVGHDLMVTIHYVQSLGNSVVLSVFRIHNTRNLSLLRTCRTRKFYRSLHSRLTVPCRPRVRTEL